MSDPAPPEACPDTVVVVERRHAGALLPRKAHATDACFDLSVPEAVDVPAGTTRVLDLGIGVELQEGWEIQLRGRSGLATRGFVVHPGTLDHLYRQNVRLIVHNLGTEPVHFQAGQRVAQMKLERVWQVSLREGSVTATARGGLGSTGL